MNESTKELDEALQNIDRILKDLVQAEQESY